MKFSVIIPLYNKETTIRRTLYSVLDQVGIDQQCVEIIVVDDGSSDESIQQVLLVQKEQSERNIRLIKQKNAGVSAARNKGAELAQHNYISFLDADDSYTPIFLYTIISLINDFPQSRFFATAYDFISLNSGVKKTIRISGLNSNKHNQLLTDFFLIAASGDLPFCASSFCIEKKLFQDVEGFPVGENMGEDQSLYCEVALNKHPIAFSPIACSHYFLAVEGSLMQTEKTVHEMPFSKRLQRSLEQKNIRPANKNSIQQYIAGHLLDLVRRNLSKGNIKAAIQQLRDPRTKYKPIKWVYWFSRTHLQLIISSAYNK